MKKRLSAIVLAMALLLCVLPLSASATAQSHDFAELEGYYKTQGRVTLNGSVLEMDTSSAGFEFYFDGSGDVLLNASVRCGYTTDMYFTVMVDGVRSRLRVETPSTGTFYERTMTLASGLAAGVHHIEFYKQTEAASGLVSARSLTYDGIMLASPPLDKINIEVVGDSISGGASMLWTSSDTESCDYPVFQDGTKTYAYLTGEALGANMRVTQTSGYGCVDGWNGDNYNLLDMFPYTSFWRSSTVEYDFDPTAQIVVINLGTNDYTVNASGRKTITPAQFKANAITLMQMAREKNPGCKIVWCTGMMGTFYKSTVTEAINELGGAQSGYYFCELPYGTSGGAGHPNEAEHARAATTLTEFLQTNCLSADYKADFATRAQLEEACNRALAVSSKSAALEDAIFWAQTELSVGTTDSYRLGCRLQALEQALDGTLVGIDLMPRQSIATFPVEANGSFIWPYYSGEGWVTLYKAGDGYYWPRTETIADVQTVNMNSTPYLHIKGTGTAEMNVHLDYKANGVFYSVAASDLAAISTVNFQPGDWELTLDLGSYLREKGHLDANGNVALLACNVYAVGNTDEYVLLNVCEINSDSGKGESDVPAAITGSYPVANGMVSNIPVGTTAAQLIAAMDNADYLSVQKDGAPFDGVLGTGAKLLLTVDGDVRDELTVVVRGDVNGDATLTTTDCRMTLSMTISIDGFSAAQKTAADLSGDGKISTTDVRTMLLSIVVG